MGVCTLFCESVLLLSLLLLELLFAPLAEVLVVVVIDLFEFAVLFKLLSLLLLLLLKGALFILLKVLNPLLKFAKGMPIGPKPKPILLKINLK